MKIKQLKWPKYQKPKVENMGWTQKSEKISETKPPLKAYWERNASQTPIQMTGTGAQQKWMINWHILGEEGTGPTVANLVHQFYLSHDDL